MENSSEILSGNYGWIGIALFILAIVLLRSSLRVINEEVKDLPGDEDEE